MGNLWVWGALGLGIALITACILFALVIRRLWQMDRSWTAVAERIATNSGALSEGMAIDREHLHREIASAMQLVCEEYFLGYDLLKAYYATHNTSHDITPTVIESTR